MGILIRWHKYLISVMIYHSYILLCDNYMQKTIRFNKEYNYSLTIYLHYDMQ